MFNKEKLKELTINLVSNPDDFIASFRANLCMYLSQKDITLAQLSEVADIPLNTLRSFVYGTARDCHLSMAVKLARALNVSVDELVGCETISEKTRGSMQIMRHFPEKFANFIHWGIRYHYNELNRDPSIKHAIEVMTAVNGDDGNVKMTNDFHIMDISNLEENLHPKIFMGIVLPTDNYIPHYYNGDVLLIANDREARAHEHVVVHYGDNIWIVQRKYELVDGERKPFLYSIRDGGIRVPDEKQSLVLGYIAKVLR